MVYEHEQAVKAAENVASAAANGLEGLDAAVAAASPKPRTPAAAASISKTAQLLFGSEMAVAPTPVGSSSNESPHAGGAESGRRAKRKRGAVDYAALDAQLRAEEDSKRQRINEEGDAKATS
jgi:hypothetical protein